MGGDGAVQPFEFTLATEKVSGVGNAMTIEEWIADFIHTACDLNQTLGASVTQAQMMSNHLAHRPRPRGRANLTNTAREDAGLEQLALVEMHRLINAYPTLIWRVSDDRNSN